MTRIATTITSLLFALTFVLLSATRNHVTAADPQAAKIPIIYDSDIGDDIDDTWALCLLLKSPEFDVKLVVGDQGRTDYRTKLFAKLLETAKRTDIPIGVGLDQGRKDSGGLATAERC